MPTRIKIPKTEDFDISEVKTVWDEAEVNTLLATKEWVLMHGGVAHRDSMGYQVKPCWVLGKKLAR